MDPDSKPSNIGPPFSAQIKVIVDMPKSFSARPVGAIEGKDTAVEVASKTSEPNAAGVVPEIESDVPEAKVKLDANMELRQNIFDKTEEKPKKCAQCSKECKDECYRSKKPSDTTVLCANCVKEGKYPANTTSEDFIKDETTVKEEPWTEQEDVLLLEGLDMYPDDWNAVADHVGTRTRDECILHYLKLPIQDPKVDAEISELGLLQFSKDQRVENPIMSVVAFLASIVKPEVAAVAAGQEPSVEGKKQQQQEEESKKQDQEAEETRGLYHELIRKKMQRFEAKMAQYQKLEAAVDQERRQLEKERYQLSQERLALKDKVLQVQKEIAKRNTVSTPATNSLTPAQIQQQLAAQASGGAMPGGAATAGGVLPQMYMMGPGQHPQAIPQHQMQMQHQYQLQFQRQLQAQQQGHQFPQQAAAAGPNHNFRFSG